MKLKVFVRSMRLVNCSTSAHQHFKCISHRSIFPTKYLFVFTFFLFHNSLNYIFFDYTSALCTLEGDGELSREFLCFYNFLLFLALLSYIAFSPLGVVIIFFFSFFVSSRSKHGKLQLHSAADKSFVKFTRFDVFSTLFSRLCLVLFTIFFG